MIGKTADGFSNPWRHFPPAHGCRRGVERGNDDERNQVRSVCQRPAAGTWGLYDPQFEHDACGVGMVVNMRGIASPDVVHKALQILCNLTHRGACGCDETTGDGAGILMQLPDAFLRVKAKELGFDLPAAGRYAHERPDLPAAQGRRAQDVHGALRKTVKDEGQVFLGWRNVPQNGAVLGDIARKVEPDIHQIFVAAGPGIKDISSTSSGSSTSSTS